MVASFTVDQTLYLGLKIPEAADVARLPRLHAYLDYDAISVPATFGHISNTAVWGILGNSICGDCTIAGSCHETMDWTHAASGTTAPFTELGAIAIYKQLSGWNGIPGDRSDSGLDMLQLAEYRRVTGIPDAVGKFHKIDAYAQVTSWDHVMKAAYVFGACAIGFTVSRSAMSQFRQGQPWSYTGDQSNEGGHYVPLMGRNSKGYGVVCTWGELQAMDQGFYEAYSMVALAYISLDYLRSTGKTPEGLNLTQLVADLNTLANG